MIAVSAKEEELYGCPNCGCNKWIRDNSFRGDQPSGTCKSCGLHFQIMADHIEKSETGFSTGRTDANGNTIFEYPVRIPHPRKGIPAWEYVYPDSKPENGEYWSSRGIGYDLSGFVKSKQAGERLLQMVKEVLGIESPKSWLDYRTSEPEWIQFKFQKEEFDLEKLNDLCSTDKIITMEILQECKL